MRKRNSLVRSGIRRIIRFRSLQTLRGHSSRSRSRDLVLHLSIDIMLFTIGTSDRLSVHRRSRIPRHPGSFDIVFLVHGHHLLVVEQIVHHKEEQRNPVDLQFVASEDLGDIRRFVRFDVFCIGRSDGNQCFEVYRRTRLGNVFLSFRKEEKCSGSSSFG
jgi:hypothetical protein